MSFKLLGGGSDLPTVISDVNQNVLELKNRETTEIFKDDTGIRRVLLGKGADGFYGLKVSKPTFDVYSAGDDELAFNSNQNVFKIIESGTKTLPGHSYSSGANWGTSSGSEVSVEHNLGFIPGVIAYAIWPGYDRYSLLPLNDWLAASSSGLFQYSITVTADSTTVYFNSMIFGYNQASSLPDIEIKYYLLQETAN